MEDKSEPWDQGMFIPPVRGGATGRRMKMAEGRSERAGNTSDDEKFRTVLLGRETMKTSRKKSLVKNSMPVVRKPKLS